MRAVIALVGVIVLAFLAAGCGSDKSSESNSTTDWANSLCSAVTTYRQSVTDAADSLKSNVSQAGFKDATNQVQKATDTFVDTVKSLSTVTTALATAQTQIKTAFDQLKGLDAQGELSDAFKQASACDSLRSG